MWELVKWDTDFKSDRRYTKTAGQIDDLLHTSTCVEKSIKLSVRVTVQPGLPPRVWRRGSMILCKFWLLRVTSTCVEKRLNKCWSISIQFSQRSKIALVLHPWYIFSILHILTMSTYFWINFRYNFFIFLLFILSFTGFNIRIKRMTLKLIGSNILSWN